MDIALTGCNGFLGTCLTRALVAAGHHVTGLLRPGAAAQHIDADLTHRVVGDLTDGPALRRLAESADVVIHAAFDRLDDQPLRSYRINVLGTLQLLDFTRLSGASQFIFVSSAAALYDVLPDRLLDENHPVRPDDPREAVKAAVEPFVTAYYERYGLNVCAVRPARMYGLHHDWKRSWKYDVVNSVTLGEPIDTTGGAYVVHVEDVCEAIVRTVSNYVVAGQIYHLVDAYVHDQDVAWIAKELTGSPSIIYDRFDERVRNHYVTTKAADTLGVDARRGPSGLRQYVGQLLERFSESTVG